MSTSNVVSCPICSKSVPSFYINTHLDSGCQSSNTTFSSAPSSSSTSSTKRKSSPPPPPPPQARGASSSKPRSSASTATTSAPPAAKKFKSSSALEDAKPLAERVRPKVLEDFVGQDKLLGPGTMLRGLIEIDRVGSCLFWGPPGTGKTTIARVIAQTTSSIFKELSATNASTADLRKVFDEATNTLKLTGRKTLLFIDEIQRFNKAQQDQLLPVVEAGLISLIASTTENPSFRVNGALLSRCRVFVLDKLSPDDIYRVLLRALRIVNAASTSSSSSPEIRPKADNSDVFASDSPIDSDLLHFLSSAADGDARVALSSLELALSATASSSTRLSTVELKTQLRKAHLQYDRTGDHHYDTISALHKSVRGGDADAALYWLARMLQGGDDPLYVARRMIRMASEDVGLANPLALPQAVAAYQSAQLLGMPECDCILAQTVVMLAESPKSVRTYKAYGKAKALVNQEINYPVPLHIRNAPTGLMKSLGYGRDYKYTPGFAHPTTQPFFPPELEGTTFLQDDESLNGRTYDEEALREWEVKENEGERWEGREEMLRRLRSGEGETKERRK